MFILQRLISFLIPFLSHARCADDSLTIPFPSRIQLTRENKSQSAKGFARMKIIESYCNSTFFAAPR
jgi:hypothetical protein